MPPVSALSLNITVPFRPTNVTSVEHGRLQFSVAEQRGGSFGVTMSLPLQAADFVLLE
jgi:hypothetical protein